MVRESKSLADPEFLIDCLGFAVPFSSDLVVEEKTLALSAPVLGDRTPSKMTYGHSHPS